MFGVSKAIESTGHASPKTKMMFGVGTVVLQILRVFTVVVLGAAAASFGVLMIKVGKGQAYFPFEAVANVFMALICLGLILTEFPLIKPVRNFIRNAWPLFSEEYGLSWLGIALFVIGCHLLGSLNQSAYDQDKMGVSLYQLVLASGILSLTFGCLNAVASFVFSSRSLRINARSVRSKGVSAKPVARRGAVADTLPDHYSVHSGAGGSTASSSIRGEKGRSMFATKFWTSKNDEAGKNSARPNISAPFQAHQDVERDAGTDEQRSPIAPDVRRPPSTFHPINNNNNRRSSFYSTAHLPRW